MRPGFPVPPPSYPTQLSACSPTSPPGLIVSMVKGLGTQLLRAACAAHGMHSPHSLAVHGCARLPLSCRAARRLARVLPQPPLCVPVQHLATACGLAVRAGATGR